MSIIDADGLFNGDRLSKCSDKARLYWPYFFLASNGYGRLRIDYRQACVVTFSTFVEPPTETEFYQVIEEYHTNYLLFIYQSSGELWGQWDTPQKCLPRHKTAKDSRSPAPDEAELADFIASYKRSKESSEKFREVSEIFGEKLRGVGVGVGVGGGVGGGGGSEKMNIEKQLKIESYKLLGIPTEHSGWTVWEEIDTLSEAFGSFAVLGAFQKWAPEYRGIVTDKPITAFLKEAASLIQDITPVATDPETEILVQQLVFVSDASVVFNTRQRATLGVLLRAWTAKEIEEAFRDFLSSIDGDSFKLRRAAENFCETAEQFLSYKKRLRLEEARVQAQASAAAARESAQADAELAELEALDAEEAAGREIL